ncbi:MAG: OmpA family protein [Hyphomicrobiales bacterium]
MDETAPIIAHFRTDGSELDDESAASIAALASRLVNCPELRLEIAGHTDSVGASAYNKTLSEERAKAVLDTLVAAGVGRDRMSAAGFGEDRPVADNATREGRAANRRIELSVIR